MQKTTRVQLVRRRRFQCRHRYEVSDWSCAENSRIFGACFTPHGHGHNYLLEVHISGEVDEKTGMILNLVDVDRLIAEVIDPIDGCHLNFDLEAFETKNPTTENLAQNLFLELKAQFSRTSCSLSQIRLYEYDDLWVDVCD